MKNCGCSSEVDPLRSLLLKRPRDAFHSRCEIERQWRELGYAAPPDLSAARLEYDAFVALLEQSGCEIAFLPFDEGTGLDSIYVRDTALMIPRGAVLMNMGKSARRSEPARTEAALREMGIPILGAITDPGTVEGGDVVVFDEQTLAVGQGYRTNPEGIRQLRGLTRPFMKDFVTVPLPHWKGPGDVLHLMSFISPVDHDLAVVYSRMMPVPFREWLLGRGIRLVEVPDEE